MLHEDYAALALPKESATYIIHAVGPRSSGEASPHVESSVAQSLATPLQSRATSAVHMPIIASPPPSPTIPSRRRSTASQAIFEPLPSTRALPSPSPLHPGPSTAHNSTRQATLELDSFQGSTASPVRIILPSPSSIIDTTSGPSSSSQFCSLSEIPPTPVRTHQPAPFNDTLSLSGVRAFAQDILPLINAPQSASSEATMYAQLIDFDDSVYPNTTLPNPEPWMDVWSEINGESNHAPSVAPTFPAPENSSVKRKAGTNKKNHTSKKHKGAENPVPASIFETQQPAQSERRSLYLPPTYIPPMSLQGGEPEWAIKALEEMYLVRLGPEWLRLLDAWFERETLAEWKSAGRVGLKHAPRYITKWISSKQTNREHVAISAPKFLEQFGEWYGTVKENRSNSLLSIVGVHGAYCFLDALFIATTLGGFRDEIWIEHISIMTADICSVTASSNIASM